MFDPLNAAMRIATSGLQAQSARLRVVSENIANAESTSSTPGGDPYIRKTLSFHSELDRAAGVSMVRAGDTGTDEAPFRLDRDPGNPAADSSGMVKRPNVDVLVEMADMREANRGYQANLQVIKQSRDMLSLTIDLLRSN